MKIASGLVLFLTVTSASAQVWKVLPKGVRAFGYRNVTTSKITNNLNQSGQETALGSSFRIDATTFNEMTGNIIAPNIDPDAYNALVVGEYEVDAEAQMNVNGFGFAYGITDNLMFYGEIAYYNADVKARMKRTAGNSYEEAARLMERNGDVLYADALRQMVDVNEATIQSVITNFYGYKPIGDWRGTGYGDMETGVMAKVLDKGTWGLMLYPGVVLPTGYEDDPDILQDVGFGDGQFDIFLEAATGYVVNDKLSFGTFLRYTYQAPTSKTLRVPEERDFELSSTKGDFDVKYGDKISWTLNSTIGINDWISFSPVYRLLYQMPSVYESKYGAANDYLAYNSDKLEHQGQITASISSITPFLKKEFLLPAQINLNYLRTLSGRNVPEVTRYEIEFRMLF